VLRRGFGVSRFTCGYYHEKCFLSIHSWRNSCTLSGFVSGGYLLACITSAPKKIHAKENDFSSFCLKWLSYACRHGTPEVLILPTGELVYEVGQERKPHKAFDRYCVGLSVTFTSRGISIQEVVWQGEERRGWCRTAPPT